MPKINASDLLILASLSVLLSCGLVSGLDWHNLEKTVAFASGEGEVLGWDNSQQMVMDVNENGFTKTSKFDFKLFGANQISLDKSSSLTVLNADGSTKTYGNTLTEDLKFSGDQNLLSIGGLYTLENGKSTGTTMLSFTNPKTGKTVDMASVDPEHPEEFIKGFIDAMDLGISYDRIMGLQSHIGIVDSEKTTANGMEFEYSLGKNTEIRA
jgi:hypothetical protein